MPQREKFLESEELAAVGGVAEAGKIHVRVVRAAQEVRVLPERGASHDPGLLKLFPRLVVSVFILGIGLQQLEVVAHLDERLHQRESHAVRAQVPVARDVLLVIVGSPYRRGSRAFLVAAPRSLLAAAAIARLLVANQQLKLLHLQKPLRRANLQRGHVAEDHVVSLLRELIRERVLLGSLQHVFSKQPPELLRLVSASAQGGIVHSVPLRLLHHLRVVLLEMLHVPQRSRVRPVEQTPELVVGVLHDGTGQPEPPLLL